ncbi:MAG: serine protease [Proteobacteria bacterium]|nr:serine protease [Pseudomonadota bacterium]
MQQHRPQPPDLRRRRLLALAGGAVALPAWAATPLPELIATAKPSVCAVGTFNMMDSPRFGFRGSGFFIGDGSIVATCWHVLPDLTAPNRTAGVTSIAVQTARPDGSLEQRDAEVLGSSRAHDLALLRIKGQPGPALPLAAAGTAREGMDVALIGYPIGGVLGFKPVTHRGIVASIVASALPTAGARQLDEGTVTRLREGSFELLQLDATAYPGNSGGPLFELETGRVIGVVNMGLVKGGRESALSQPTGITYALPVRYLHALIAENRS